MVVYIGMEWLMKLGFTAEHYQNQKYWSITTMEQENMFVKENYLKRA